MERMVRTLWSILTTLLVTMGVSGYAVAISGHPRLSGVRADPAIHRPEAAIVERRPAMELSTPTSPESTAASAASSARKPATTTPEPTPTSIPPTPVDTPRPPVPTATARSSMDTQALRTVAMIPDTGSSRTQAQSLPPPTVVATAATGTQWTRLPITRVRIPTIALDEPVVVAPIVEVDGSRTWSVPSFRVGHGQYTAGAGQVGNAVLFGHVASLHDGSVFRNLHRVRTGDIVQIFSGSRQFDYRVVAERIVSPDDISVLQPTGTASLIIITCAGEWMPRIDDYNERLVVRADLVSSRVASVNARKDG
jgi:LPXTG-site transpeptidase (sortase) family protein